jgi:hypothetical protein
VLVYLAVFTFATALALHATSEASPMKSRSERLRELVSSCKDDYTRFGWSILGRDGSKAYWSRQREICRSVVECHTTVVPAGNAVGKSYVASGIGLGFLYTRPGSLVFTSAPTQAQLQGVLWKEMSRAHSSARVPLGGKISGSGPIKLELGDGWMAYGHVSGKVEAMSGHHARDLLAIVDEASGVPQAVYDAVDSLNPSRRLLIGNPLRGEGTFYELCRQADEGADPKLLRKIVIPSTESPHAHLERSPCGMADRTWLEAMRSQYGENSLWWLSHVLALFPGESDDTLVLKAWIDLASKMVHVRSGPTRISIDLGLGVGGGDRTVIVVRDDNGVLEIAHSRNWNLEVTASRVALLAQKHEVDGKRISWDATGIGADFLNRLKAVGLVGCRPYMGGFGGPNISFANLRSASAWAARRRLDPETILGKSDGVTVARKQHPFAIRPEHAQLLRDEVCAHRYSLDPSGAICLELGETIRARLRHSPDFADAFFQSFAFPG